jgi:enoyl-CoA hydratase/carnithine racemase
VATVTLNRPERKNPLTFERLCRAARPVPTVCAWPTDVHAVVVTGAGGNFCSGGDVHEIIGPLIRMTACPSCWPSPA